MTSIIACLVFSVSGGMSKPCLGHFHKMWITARYIWTGSDVILIVLNSQGSYYSFFFFCVAIIISPINDVMNGMWCRMCRIIWLFMGGK